MRMLGWLAKAVLTATLVSLIAVATTWVTVNIFLDKLLSQFEAASGIRVELSEVLAQLSGFGNSLLTPQLDKKASMGEREQQRSDSIGHDDSNRSPDDSIGDDPGDASQEQSSGPANEQRGDEEDDPANDHVPDDAIPVWSGQTQTDSQKAGSAGDQILITGEQFIQVRDQMSNDDKMKIFALLFQKLPQQEIQNLSVLMEDGITGEELEQIDGIVSQYLSEEEYEEIKQLLSKY